jgi:endonuclease/exonuclease/phosphatase family metal-dependent hydrolase
VTKAVLVRSTTATLDGPSSAWREGALDQPPEDHGRLYDDAAALHALEIGPDDSDAELPERLRVVAWNAERLKRVEASADLLRHLDADVILLSEVDLGMARSGNRRNAADLATLLGMTWDYGVEFVELGIGDEDERREHRGQENAHGLHGGAILARLPIQEPAMIRLESDGAWFSGERKGERRVGGRIALTARIQTSRGPVGVVATHFESHSDPDHRAAQMRVLLDALDEIDPELPWLIGGDVNVNTVTLEERAEPGWRDRVLADAPNRLLDPVPYEPLFEVARSEGYEWQDANTPGVPTQRLKPGEPDHPLGRIDWFFSRGLACSELATVPATDAEGAALSDHEILAVTVERR